MKFLITAIVALFLSIGLGHTQTVNKALYIMRGPIEGVYKIGVSNDPYRRVYEIDRKVSRDVIGDVQLIAIYPNKGSLERRLHKALSHRKVIFVYGDGTNSREWFRLSKRDFNYITNKVFK